MKFSKNLPILVVALLIFISCHKETDQIIQVPNGDFEIWNPDFQNWVVESDTCLLMPPFLPYVTRADSSQAQQGQSALKIRPGDICGRSVYNSFPILIHPNLLSGYIKSNIALGDTATIHIDLFMGSQIVDSGVFYETHTNSTYRNIEIPISENNTAVDSVQIKITGGKMAGTELFVDHLVLLKRGN
jgi:hypothetical protein